MSFVGPVVLATACGGLLEQTTYEGASEGGAQNETTTTTDAATHDAAQRVDVFDAGPPCGVDAGAPCEPGRACLDDADCASAVCSSITRRCVPPLPPLAPDTTIDAIVAGNDHTCALWSDGVAKCWGSNAYGQLGLGDTIGRGKAPGEMGAALPAVQVAPGKVISAIKAGGDHTCVTYTTGSTDCFGRNDSGQLGIDSKLPVLAPGQGGRWPHGAFGSHSCAFEGRPVNFQSGAPLSAGAGLRCWGGNAFGQLGAGDVRNRGDDPGEMASLPFIPFPAAGYTTLVLDPNGATAQHSCISWRGAPSKPPATHHELWEEKVACWGRNDKGQLGLGQTAHLGDQPGEGPAIVDIGSDFPGNYAPGRMVLAAAGGSHSCVLVKQYAIWGTPYVKCWGDNSRGQLGLGDTDNRGDEPGEMGDALLPVKGVPRAFDGKYAPLDSPYMALGAAHSCVLTVDPASRPNGVVQCWGANDFGQLGQGSTIDRGTAPGQMPPPIVDLGTSKKVTTYASGANHVCAVLLGVCTAATQPCAEPLPTTIKCWGKNDKGQLGLGDTSHRGDAPGEMGDALPVLELR